MKGGPMPNLKNKIQIRGLAGLATATRRIEGDTLEQVGKAVAVTALNIEREAKHRAPVDTGRLRASIQHSVSGTSGAVYSDVEYALHQEFGTTNMTAQPFLLPAFLEEKPKFEKRLGAIGRGLR
jgi:HK97 gp10 family phage protein